MMSSEEKEVVVCPPPSLPSVAACETEHELDPSASARAASGRSTRVRLEALLRRDLSRESIEAGPPSLWRYAPLLPVAPPAEPGSRRG